MTTWMRYGLLALALITPGGLILVPLWLAIRNRSASGEPSLFARLRTWWGRGDLTGRPSFNGSEQSCR